MKMIRLFLLALLISLQYACSLGGGPAPADHFYRLPELVLSSHAKPEFNNIVIKPVKSSGLYHERAILFIESDKPLELQRYHYSFWSTPPAEIVHEALYQGISTSNISLNISRELTSVRPDYIIDSRILHFERLIDGENVSIHVAIESSVRSGTNLKDGWTKRYETTLKLETADMHASVEVFGQAMRQLVQQLLDDIMLKK